MLGDKTNKCKYPDGVDVKIGPFSVDPCRYETIELHQNCTVEIVRCIKCGYTDIRWYVNKPEEGDFEQGLDEEGEE